MKKHLLRYSLVAFLLAPAFVNAETQTTTQLYAEGVQAYNQGNVTQAKHKLQLALDIDKDFRPASALLKRIETEGTQGAAPLGISTTLLSRTFVPVEFKDATLDSALEYLRQHVDETTKGRLKLNFVLNLPPDLAHKHVTLKLEHAPVTEVLRYMGDLTGVDFDIQKYAIVVKPAVGGQPVNPTPHP